MNARHGVRKSGGEALLQDNLTTGNKIAKSLGKGKKKKKAVQFGGRI